MENIIPSLGIDLWYPRMHVFVTGKLNVFKRGGGINIVVIFTWISQGENEEILIKYFFFQTLKGYLLSDIL